MIRDYFVLIFRSLQHRKLRSWLTMFGIFVGIAAVVGLISLSQGLQNAITQQFEDLGIDKIIIQSKTLGPPGSVTNEALILTSEDLETIRRVRGVEDAAGILMKSGPVKYKDQQEVLFVIGGNENYLDLFEDNSEDVLRVIEGRSLRDNDKFKALVGYDHAFGDLWEEPVRIGSSLEIEGQKFKVVGIQEKVGNPFDDGAVIVLKETLAEILEIEDEESQIIAKVASGFDPEEVAQDIERRLRRERDEDEGQETFTVQTSEQILETFSTIFSIVQAVLIGIAAISLLVGGIGIMNTMYTAVLEKTKDIGIMKSIGATNKDILSLFLLESGFLGLVGGLIGVIIGIGLAKGVEFFAMQAYGTPLIQASISPTLIVGALLFSFIIGALSGTLPARQASKLKPVEALRYE